MSQKRAAMVHRRDKRKAAKRFQEIVQKRRDKWFDTGKLKIPGVEWESKDFVRRVYDSLDVELAGWVLGTKDIPSLRHTKNDRLMHARGRLSMAKVLKAISLFVDYRTVNIAVPYQDPHTGLWYWAGRSIKVIADAAGVGYWACKRRIDWIVKKGLMSRFPQAGELNGEKYGRPSIRNLIQGTLWKSIGPQTAAAVTAAQGAAYQLWKDAQENIKPVIDAVKLAREKAASALDRAKDLPRTRSRSREIGRIMQQLLGGMAPDYLQKPAPS
jgi:hypothetical protein